MKSKKIKRITGIGAVALAGVIVFSGIRNAILTVEAADTLFGIERLIQEVQDRGEKGSYTILEVVPDEAAAEIGYYVPGYEPALSVRSEDGTGEWSNWQEGLSKLRSEEERTAYMAGLQQNLENFYAARGFDDMGKVPVSYEEYQESSEAQDGYTKLSFADEERYGYFALAGETDSGERYEIAFENVGYTQDDDLDIRNYCYLVSDEVEITQEEYDDIEDDAFVYYQKTDREGRVIYAAARWQELKDTVSGGDAGPAVSDGNGSVTGNNLGNPNTPNNPSEGTGFYLVTFEKWNQEETLSVNTALYMVQEFAEKENGEYVFVETEDGFTTAFAAGSIYYKGGFVNHEWFHRNVINFEPNQTDNFRMQVITLTPTELNALLAAGAMPEFDMLYLNSGMQTFPDKADGSGMMQYAADNDIDVAVRNALFQSVVTKGKPCIVDGMILYGQDGVKNTELENTQIFYLCVMCLQESPKALADQLIGEDVAGVENPSVDTLWGNIYRDDDKNFVVEQAYCFYAPSTLVSQSFADFNIYQEGQEEDIASGFGVVLAEILSENENRLADTTNTYAQLPTDVSQATVVRHVMNYAKRRQIVSKTELHVLELQPCKVSTPDLTEEEVKKWAGSQDVHVHIDTMTTAEFIGRIEDINENYDLIYIGTDRDYMNVDDKGNTVFNDTSMNGLIYFHTGDMRYTTIELGGQLKTEYVDGDPGKNLYFYNPMRYGGNDITEEKKEALLDFLNASYPIVLSDDFYMGNDKDAVTLYNTDNYKKAAYTYGVGIDNLEEKKEYNGIMEKIDADVNSFVLKEGFRVSFYSEDDAKGTLLGSFDGPYREPALKDNVPNQIRNRAQSIKVEYLGGSRDIDTTHIDNSSYMYQFVKAAEKKNNLYKKSEVEQDTELFQFYLNRPKIGLEPISISGMQNQNANNNEVYMLESDAEGRYLLTYKFTIANEGAASANTKYQCRFYIDVNADGKFSGFEELTDMTVTQDGNPVQYNELYAGKEYVMSRYVPEGYKGVLPWKVQIEQVTNPYIHNGFSGYTKLTEMEQETLHILQICRDMVTADHENASRLFNLKTEIADKNSAYHALVYGGTYEGVTYAGIQDDFIIDVDFMLISDFEEAFQKNPNLLENYNMLILGFSDMYGEISGSDTEGPMKAIIDFINSGKSVLFAHDSISYFNYNDTNADGTVKQGQVDRTTDVPHLFGSNQHHNAYSTTKYLRDMVGMDRYGITGSELLKEGADLNADRIAELNPAKDVAYIPGTAGMQSYGLTQGYTYYIINARDKRHDKKDLGGVKETYSAAETGGEAFTNTYLNLNFGKVYYKNDFNDYGEMRSNTNGEVTNLWVTKVNDGQITNYPYKLRDTFQVSATHGQYYQLDYRADADQDGQTDLVVWYCLGNRANADGSNPQETIYSASPNDVVNNYYIYNKGNITYTGVGHSGSSYTVEEAKLFINTMIASYNAGIKAPTVTALSDGNIGAREIDSVYRYYDAVADRSYSDTGALRQDDVAADQVERVYFTVRDPNFVKGDRLISLQVYKESDAENATTITCDGEMVKAELLPADAFSIHSASTEQELTGDKDLVSGGIYYLEIDKGVMGDYSRFPIYFEVHSTLPVNGVMTDTENTYSRFDFTKVMMFDLG